MNKPNMNKDRLRETKALLSKSHAHSSKKDYNRKRSKLQLRSELSKL